MESVETEFLVLRITRYGENKLIVNGLAPDAGRLSFITYGGVGGGKRGGLEFGLFRLLHVMYEDSGKDLLKCQSVESLDDYGNVSKDFQCYTAACWLSQFSLANLQPGLPCTYYFKALKIGLKRLAQPGTLPEIVLTGIILVFLREGGWLSDYVDSPQSARQIQTLLEMALGGSVPKLTTENWRQLHDWAICLLRLNDECIMPGNQGKG